MVKLIRSVRGVRRVIKTLKSKSLDRRVKNKGESVLDRFFWKCFYMVLETGRTLYLR